MDQIDYVGMAQTKILCVPPIPNMKIC